MSWAVGYDERWKRDIGYGVPATCDYPGCGASINRGLSHVCGGEPYGGTFGCGLFFCAAHLQPTRAARSSVRVCGHCYWSWSRPTRQFFTPTPDTLEWTEHKATHPSWAEWRAQHSNGEKTHVEADRGHDD